MDKQQRLKNISPDKIEPNPENPRLVFRQEEMENLMTSIAEYGIQVPVTVYGDGKKFYLLDGERRWRCSKKLNLQTIPALVQEKPTELNNLLLMSNIHALREQWDYFTIAKNLERITSLFKLENDHTPNEGELSEVTGLGRGQIRRCRLILSLPEKYKIQLMEELELPKSQQRLSEDLLLEMERSLKTVTTRLPEFNEDLDSIRDILVDKFRDGTINAVTDFRQLTKIATAIDSLGIRPSKARNALKRIFTKNNISIKDAYERTVEFEYDEKKAANQVSFLIDYFNEIVAEEKIAELDLEFLDELEDLMKALRKLLKRRS